MTESEKVIKDLHQRAQAYQVKELVEITQLDKETIRKIRNNVRTGTLMFGKVMIFEFALNKHESRQRKIEAGKRAVGIANKLTPEHRSVAMAKLNKARAL